MWSLKAVITLAILYTVVALRIQDSSHETKKFSSCKVSVNGTRLVADQYASLEFIYTDVYREDMNSYGLVLKFELPILREGTQSFSLVSKDAQYTNGDPISRILNEHVFDTVKCEAGLPCVIEYTFYNISNPAINTPSQQNSAIDHLKIKSKSVNICFLDIFLTTYPVNISMNLRWILLINSTVVLEVKILHGFPLPIKFKDLLCDGQRVNHVEKLSDRYLIPIDEVDGFAYCEVTAYNNYPAANATKRIPVNFEKPTQHEGNDTENGSNATLLTWAVIILFVLLVASVVIIIVVCLRKKKVVPVTTADDNQTGIKHFGDVPNHAPPMQPTSIDCNSCSSGFEETNNSELDRVEPSTDVSVTGSVDCFAQQSSNMGVLHVDNIDNNYSVRERTGNIEQPSEAYKVGCLDEAIHS